MSILYWALLATCIVLTLFMASVLDHYVKLIKQITSRAKKAESERDYYKQLWLQSTSLTFGENAKAAIIDKYQLKD